jgi:hypothetical protein
MESVIEKFGLKSKDNYVKRLGGYNKAIRKIGVYNAPIKHLGTYNGVKC